MERLPQELLPFIVEDLSTRDLQAIRLVTKALAAAANPFLFHTIPVWLSIRSLQKLTWLSEHPGLAHYVHTVALSPLRLIAHKHIGAYEASVRDWFEDQHCSPSAHEYSVGRHMAAYKNYMEEQCLLTAESLDVKILSRALTAFTNLQGLNIDFCPRHIGVRELFGAFGPFSCEGLLRKDCEYTLPVVLRALSQSRAEIKFLGLGQGEGNAYCPSDCPDLDAASAGSAPLSSPSSTRRHPSMEPVYPAVHQAFLGGDKPEYRHALRGVRELAVGDISDPYGGRPSVEDMITGIRRLISFAPHLETVTVGEMPHVYPFRPTLLDIFDTHHLKHLRILELDGYDTKEQHLIDFFTNHSATVVDIRFKSMWITDSDWSTVLARLKNLTFPVLDCFGLYNCIDYSGGWIWADDYILHKTDKDPIVEEEERQEEELWKEACEPDYSLGGA